VVKQVSLNFILAAKTHVISKDKDNIMVVRIAGINLQDNKTILIALTSIFGIGRHTAASILKEAQIASNTKVKDLSDGDIEKIRTIAESEYKLEGDLRVEIIQNIKRLKEINSLRGVRHNRGLPVRGQRTKTNARTKRGKKVTVGSGRKKAAEKT